MYSRPSTAKPNLCRTTNSCFTVDKKNTAPFFRTTRVASCNKVVIRNGRPIAICYKVRNQKGLPLNAFKLDEGKLPEKMTIYQKDYCIHPDVHLGMDKKPLVPYTPNSYRNRLPIDNSHTAYKNTSRINIGDNNLVNRKQWKSINRSSYKRPKSSYISNPGILSDMAKRAHYQQQSIFYN